jgi:hypothetical protein
MQKTRFSEEQIVPIIREADRKPVSASPSGMVSANRQSTPDASASGAFSRSGR